jgi:predicted DNA-binding transcriptional regulator YafY
MLPTSARLLRLLTLMQTRPAWVGADLARRLEVTDRTLRRDVDKLRSLGYPVQSTVGTGGGYRLGAGTSLPPLLFDNDEAVAVVLGLRTNTAGNNVEEASARALAKLEQLLPTRLRRRIAALQTAIVSVPRGNLPAVNPRTLTALAASCHERHRVAFDYLGNSGETSRRSVEPHRLVHTGRRWYLVAWDVNRGDWRTFRVDRVGTVTESGAPFAARPPPDEDLARYVSKGAAVAAYPVRARVVLLAPLARAAEALPPQYGHLESLDAGRCVATLGGRTYKDIVIWLGYLGLEFEVLEPPGLIAELRTQAQRYARAAGT